MTRGSEAFWLLTEPFDERPDARFLVPTRPVRAALTCLQETLVSRPGWVVVAGQRGVGKSVLATLFLESLGEAHPFAVVPDAGVPPAEVRAEIDEQLGEAGRPPTQDALLRANRAGRRPVVVLDGAETLGEGTVSELERAFAAPGGSTTGRLLVDFVAVLERAPGSPPPAWARERGVSVIVLEPLDARDTAAYVRRRVRLAAGGERELFDEGALDEVFRRTGGLPEGINRVCALALDRVATDGGSQIGAEDVRTAAERLGDLPPVIHAAIDHASTDDKPSPPPAAAAGPAAAGPTEPSTSPGAASTPEPPPAPERTPGRLRPAPTRAPDRTSREPDVEPRPGTSPWVVLGAAFAGSVVGGLLVLFVTGQTGGGVPLAGTLPEVATPPPITAPLDASAAPAAGAEVTAPPAGAAAGPEPTAPTTRSNDAEDGAPDSEPGPTAADAAEGTDAAAATPATPVAPAPTVTPSAPEAAPDATAAREPPTGEPGPAPSGADAMPSPEPESPAPVASGETAERTARPGELAAVAAAPPLESPAPPEPSPPRVGLPLRDAGPILERALAGRVPAGTAFTVRFYGGRANATDVVERGEIAWADLDGRLSTLAVLEGQGSRRPAHLLDREGARAPGSVRVFFPDERVVRTAAADDPFAGTGFRYTDFLPLRAADFEIDAFEGDLLEGQPVFVVTARLRHEPATGRIELVIGERDGRLLEWRAFQAPGDTPVRRVVMPRDAGTPGSEEWRVYDAGSRLVARARIDSAPLADDLDPDLFTFSRLNDPDFAIPRR